ncbi:hypothetical protein DYBT9275_02334 [Dyadobacter sp. CECT 9275]|uniref:FecR family protein n=1 Tax=Dyadobacter helix TaxID=2822344 RepID=A0A916JBM6_9BACT|nr:FecR family protein [Dyadobacter sp. CECT 9275]CAG4999880.1 hypothetical protein DYBT9275_02334 [Dyadobacter sp. CECT 9275]
MKNYADFSSEDFLTDPLFRAWVLDQHEEAKLFWEQWLLHHEDKSLIVANAAAMLLALREKVTLPTNAEIENQVESTLRLIKQDKGSLKGNINWLRIGASMAAILCLTMGIRWFFQPGFLPGFQLGSVQQVQEYKSEIYAFHENDIIRHNEGNQPETIRLSDESTVVLYPESELRYPSEFGKGSRAVHLKGQGFFEVTKDPDRPFIVFANDLITKVLGTSFTVTAYENESQTRVSVKTGRVSVFSSKDQAGVKKLNSKEMVGVILTPNQEVIYGKEEPQLRKRIVEDPQIIAPVPPQLTFDETPVTEVFAMLEKAYGIEIVYDEKVLANCFLTANLTDVTLYQGLDLVSRIISARYEMMDGKVIIYSKGCRGIQ